MLLTVAGTPMGINEIQRPMIVAIAGASGSGKTWLAKKLKQSLGRRAGLLSLDDFYRDLSDLPMEKRGRVNFDHPKAIDWKLLAECLKTIQHGERAMLPRYDFATHTRRAKPRVWQRHPVVLVEGLWLLRRPELRRMYSLSIFVDCPGEIRLRRRMVRDVRDRGRTPDSVRQQFRDHVEPMRVRFVEPQRRWATCCVASPLSERVFKRLLGDVRSGLRKLDPSTAFVP